MSTSVQSPNSKFPREKDPSSNPKLNLAGRYPPAQTNSHEPKINLNLEKSQSKEANN
jgi:hypothetical protein